ncbi:MAG: iron-containing alcohol dehydrogenase [bacterium]|nr:iron-containing alcohol dehydrogenase [bacterium]
MNFNFYAPTRVLFGNGQLNNLNIQAMPGKRALIVISNGKSTKENGYLERLQEQLSLANVDYDLFDEIEPNPLKSTVMNGAEAARANGCDFIVALGGGSVMDAAKAIAAMATNNGDLWDYISGGTGKAKQLENTPLPIIAITTTAGTGSEVDQWGVISNDKTNEKIGFGGYDSLFPVLAVVDPELMATVPPKFTAYQGFDALFHSTEVYISKFANLMSDMTALTAIEAVSNNLVAAVKDGGDMAAREKVAFGNTISGYSMVVGACTSEHSLEHALSAYHHDLPHGAGLIMISKAYYSFLIHKHICDDRFIKMAQVMGIKDANKPTDFITALVNLQKDCGVDDLKMSDYGITPDEFEKIAKNAMETMGGLFESDPYPLTIDDCVEILQASYK